MVQVCNSSVELQYLKKHHLSFCLIQIDGFFIRFFDPVYNTCMSLLLINTLLFQAVMALDCHQIVIFLY